MAHARNKILCVEDDRETAALIAEELVDRGFEVSVAHSGQEGLIAILRDRPDLVLCDISMPVMSGFEVLERLTEIAPQLARLLDRGRHTVGKADPLLEAQRRLRIGKVIVDTPLEGDADKRQAIERGR